MAKAPEPALARDAESSANQALRSAGPKGRNGNFGRPVRIYRILARGKALHAWASLSISWLVVALLVEGAFGQTPNVDDPGRMFGNHDEQASSEDWATVAELSVRQLMTNPRSERAWEALVRARINELDPKRAEQALRQWRAKVSPPPVASDKMEGELASAEFDAPRAVEAWKRYLQKEPRDDAAWRQLALACADEEDWAGGVDAMGNGLAIRADAEGFVERARLRIRQHDWAGAESDVRQANRMDATNVDLQGIFPIFERSNQWLPEVTALDQIVQKQPHDFQFRLDRAEWLWWSGFKAAARDDIEAAFQMNPKSLRARFWHGLAAQDQYARDKAEESGDDSSESRADKDKARLGEVMPMAAGLITTDFERALKAADGETDPEARAEFLLKYNQPLMALQEVRDVEGSPARAQALISLDRLTEAGRVARRATEMHPDSPMAWLALARWELASGNYRETLDAVGRAERAGKTTETEDLRNVASERLGKP